MTSTQSALCLDQWLQYAQGQLQPLLVQDAQADLRYEAQRLVADVLDYSMTKLQLLGQETLDLKQLAVLNHALQRRQQGEPLAYITGRWWFWDLELAVAPCTLIPRPDTELLVETALGLSLPSNARVLDLGTGSGAIALALAKAKPLWQVQAVDFNPDAVALARQNAERLGLSRCHIQQSDWFSAIGAAQFDLIISNPPYIDSADPHLQQGEVRFEPLSALVAPAQGLADIQLICQQAPNYLVKNGWLWLEHGYQQADAVRELLQQHGFQGVHSKKDFGGNWRISGGKLR